MRIGCNWANRNKIHTKTTAVTGADKIRLWFEYRHIQLLIVAYMDGFYYALAQCSSTGVHAAP